MSNNNNNNNNGPRRIKLTSADGNKSVELQVKKAIYDLDAIADEDTRTDSSKPFVAHIKEYNPSSTDKNIKSVVPLDLKIGSMWIARRNNNL